MGGEGIEMVERVYKGEGIKGVGRIKGLGRE